MARRLSACVRLRGALFSTLLVSVWLVPETQAQQADPAEVTVGEALQQRGMHEEAVARFERFLRTARPGPEAARAAYRAAVSFEALGRRAEAIAMHERALGMTGGPEREFAHRHECRYRLGMLQQAAGETAKAAAIFGLLVRELPESHYLRASVSYAHGECLRATGEVEGARAAFLAAAAADTGTEAKGAIAAPALHAAALLARDQELPDEALGLWDRIAREYPEHAAAVEARYLSAELLRSRGDLERAAERFAALAQLETERRGDAVLGLAACQRAQHQDAAALRTLTGFEERFADHPRLAEAKLERGRALLALGRSEDAARELATPGPEGGLLAAQREEALGLAALDRADGDAALAHFERMLQHCRAMAPSGAADERPAAARDEQPGAASPVAELRARAELGIGEARTLRGEAEAALESLHRALARTRDPELAGEIRYALVLALHRAGQFAASIRAAEALLAATTPHRLAPQARLAIAENLYAAQDYAEALAAYAPLVRDARLGLQARYMSAWCALLGEAPADAATRFAALARELPESDPRREEAAALVATAQLRAGAPEAALAAADLYRARHPRGTHAARTERVAARAFEALGRPREARRCLARAAELETDHRRRDQDLLEAAELAYGEGDYRTAQERFETVAGARGALALRAREGLAWCAFELGDDERCQELCRSLRAADPDGHEAPAPANGAARATAEQDSATASDLRPADAPLALRAFVLELALLHRAERWAEAHALAAAALERYPAHSRSAELRYAHAIALARLNQHEEAWAALRALQRAGAQGGAFARLPYELAWAAERAGKHEEALAAFVALFEHGTDPAERHEAALHAGLLLLAKDPEEARTWLARVEGPHRGRALYHIGWSQFEAGAHAEAHASFTALAELGAGHELHGEALFLLGECSYAQQQWTRAAEELVRALQQAPKDVRAPRALLHHGHAALESGDAARAKASLARWLQRPPKDAADGERLRAHLWLGRALHVRGEHRAAEAELRKVTEGSQGPLAAEAQFSIGLARRAAGDEPGAAEAFATLAFLYGHAEWVQRGLLEAGRSYEQQGAPDKAQRFYAELVREHPQSEAADTARARLREIGGGK